MASWPSALWTMPSPSDSSLRLRSSSHSSSSLSFCPWVSCVSQGRSEEHTSELQSHRYLHSFPTRRSSDLLDHAFAVGLELALEIQLPLLEQLELLPVGELRVAEYIRRPFVESGRIHRDHVKILGIAFHGTQPPMVAPRQRALPRLVPASHA